MWKAQNTSLVTYTLYFWSVFWTYFLFIGWENLDEYSAADLICSILTNLQIEQIIDPVLFALSQSVPQIEQIIYPVLFALSQIVGVGVGPDVGVGSIGGVWGL